MLHVYTTYYVQPILSTTGFKWLITVGNYSAHCIATYPGLLTPAFVACSTNAGEGLVKLDVWRSGTFLLYSCKVAFWNQETSPRLSDVEHSVVLWSVFAIGSALAYLLLFQECATPPHVQVRHATWLSFTRPSPALVLQCWGEKAWVQGYITTTFLEILHGPPLLRSSIWFCALILT